ncbi:ras-related protein Rab-28-like [Agrilus planipennis]|uniref:Ras-related protein Rab-28-like n=1 Tax=Agrilus planipennis TaxID=224129 RepID=A0A1W4X3R5_AGRPL|nr:ras-related protein Rab-28-like [Agrilus planipennis]
MSESDDEVTEKYIKIVFVGDSTVGKSSIIRRFCFNEFSRNYNGTSGADFYRKHVVLPSLQNTVLKITDVSGQELSGTMLDKYLFKCDIVILVYDITNSASFDVMSDWISTLYKYLKKSPPISAIFGNKCDLEHQRAVRLDKTRDFVQEHKVQNFLVSARTGEKVFSSILELVYKHLGLPLPTGVSQQSSSLKSPSAVVSHCQKDKRKKSQSSSAKTTRRLQSPVCLLQ